MADQPHACPVCLRPVEGHRGMQNCGHQNHAVPLLVGETLSGRTCTPERCPGVRAWPKSLEWQNRLRQNQGAGAAVAVDSEGEGRNGTFP